MRLVPLSLLTFTAGLVLVGANAIAPDEDIKIYIDAPQPNTTVADINTIRGWAIHPYDVIDYVEIWIDGVFSSSIPVGGARLDVANAYPDYLWALNSGWAQTYNFKVLQPGLHEVEIIAYTMMGSYNSITTQFCTDGFISEFIRDPESIKMTTVERIHIWNNRFIFEGVQVEGRKWNVELSWNTSTQGFEITQTTPYTMIDQSTTYSCGESGIRTCQGTWCTEE